MTKILLQLIVAVLLPFPLIAMEYNTTFSDDGRYMVYTFYDDDSLSQVALLDRLTDETTLISADRFGNAGDASSEDAMISGDGRFIVYTTRAENISEESVHHYTNILVFDRINASTQWLARGQTASITPDGRFVAFLNRDDSSEFDTNNMRDVYLHDLVTRELELVSVVDGQPFSSQFGASPGSDFLPPWISEDGRFVTFETRTALVSDDRNDEADVYIRDRLLETTSRVSVNNDNIEGNDGSYRGSISRGGQFVVFSSRAENLVSNDENALIDNFIRDLTFDTTNRISDFDISREGLELFSRPVISKDDKFIAYFARNFGGERFELWFVHDLERGTYRKYFTDVVEDLSHSGFIKYAGLGWVPLNIDPVCPDPDGDNLGPGNCVPFATDGSSFNEQVYEGLECVDGDGDGFGWQQPQATPGRSCIIDNNDVVVQQPMMEVYCVDTDGDGWGWNGVQSCMIDSEPQTVDSPNEPPASGLCIDSDGDGWGWDGTQSCLIQSVAEYCIDTDGDGWGWDGSESCLIER